MKKVFILFVLLILLSINSLYSQNLEWNVLYPYNPVLAVVENDIGEFIISTENGHYLSKDKGKSWNQIDLGAKRNFFNKIPNGRIFSSIYDYPLNISTDNGYTWYEANGIEKSIGINGIIYNNDNTHFLSSYLDGLYKSVDYGDNWEKLYTFPLNEKLYKNYVELYIATDSKNNLYASIYDSYFDENSNKLTTTLLYYSSDEGITWQSKKLDSTMRNNVKFFFIDKNDNMFFLTSEKELYKSTDLGDSYTKLPISDAVTLSMDKQGNIYYSNSTATYKSTDAGDTWIEWANRRINSSYFSENNEVIFSDKEHIYYKANDTSDLVKSFNFFYSKYISSMSFDSSNNIWVGTKNTGLYYSMDSLKSWIGINSLNFDQHTVTDIVCLENNGLYITLDSLYVYKSNDLGLSFQIDTLGLDSARVNKIISYESSLFLATNKGVYSKNTDSTFWEKFDSNFNDNVNDIIIDKERNLFVGTDSSGILKSSLTNPIFIEINNDLPNKYVTKIVVNSKNEIYVGTWGDGVFKFDNNQNKWIAKNNILQTYTNILVNDFAITKQDELLLGLEGYGFFYSNNDAVFWELNKEGFPPVVDNDYLWGWHIFKFIISPDGKIYIALKAKGADYPKTEKGGGLIYSEKPLNNKILDNAWKELKDCLYNINECAISWLFFSNDENVIYSYSPDQIIRKWDLQTGFITQTNKALLSLDYYPIYSQLFFINDSLALFGNTRFIDSGTGNLYLSLINYKKDTLISEVVLLADTYCPGYPINIVRSDNVVLDFKNGIAFCNMQIDYTDNPRDIYTKYYFVMLNIYNGDIIKDFGEINYRNITIDTTDNTYSLQTDTHKKIDKYGNTIFEYECPYGEKCGISYPVISKKRKLLSGYLYENNNYEVPLFYFWDYETGKLIDSLDKDVSLDDYSNVYHNYTNDDSKVIIRYAVDNFYTDNYVLFWDIKKHKIVKEVEFPSSTLSNPVVMPNRNSAYFVYCNHLIRVDYDDIMSVEENANIDLEENIIFPNPAKDIFTIQFSEERNDILRVDVVDLNGRTVKQFSNFEKGSKQLKIETEGIENGLYFVIVRMPKETLSYKLIINN